MTKPTARAIAAAAYAAASRGDRAEAERLLAAAPDNLRPIATTMLNIARERARHRGK